MFFQKATLKLVVGLRKKEKTFFKLENCDFYTKSINNVSFSYLKAHTKHELQFVLRAKTLKRNPYNIFQIHMLKYSGRYHLF